MEIQGQFGWGGVGVSSYIFVWDEVNLEEFSGECCFVLFESF